MIQTRHYRSGLDGRKGDEMRNEMKVLRAFVKEFHPFYAGNVSELTHNELREIVKEIAKEL